jgi:inorganic pyrophosphatase
MGFAEACTAMLTALRPFDDDGQLQVVIETPRRSALKYKFEPTLGAFTVSRQLMTGLSYPYDWGFIPGTRAEDGDPLDAMVLHANATFPGIVLACRALGVISVEQKDGRGSWIANDRLIVRPDWNGHEPFVEHVRQLPAHLIEQLEQFFVNTSYFTAKKLRIAGWRGPSAAMRLVKKTVL